MKIKEDNIVICGPTPKFIQSLLPIQRSVNMDFGVNSFDKLHHNEEVVGRIVNTEDSYPLSGWDIVHADYAFLLIISSFILYIICERVFFK